MRTKERLAAVLADARLPKLAKLASEGYYDDYESPLTTPCFQLVADLRAVGHHDLAERAERGEWDGTREEGEEWFQREGRRFLQ